MVKRIISLFLLLLFIYNISGYYIVFIGQQYSIKKEVKKLAGNDINIEQLTSFKINQNNSKTLKWVEEKEFIYKGELYDVIKKVYTSKSIVYYCLKDKAENSLFQNLKKQLETNTDKNSPSNSKKNLSAKKIITHAVVPEFNFNTKTSSLNSGSFFYLNIIHTIFIDVTTPPPKELIS